MLDALDGDPDPNAAAEPDEASLHPATLAADRAPALVVRFPVRGRQVFGNSGHLHPPPAFALKAGR